MVREHELICVCACRCCVCLQATAESERLLPTLDEGSKYFPDRQRGLGMTGTGLILINPSFQLDTQLSNLCDFLSSALPVPVKVQGHQEPQLYKAKYSITWLTPERIPKEETAAAALAAAASAIKPVAKASPAPAGSRDRSVRPRSPSS